MPPDSLELVVVIVCDQAERERLCSVLVSDVELSEH